MRSAELRFGELSDWDRAESEFGAPREVQGETPIVFAQALGSSALTGAELSSYAFDYEDLDLTLALDGDETLRASIAKRRHLLPHHRADAHQPGLGVVLQPGRSVHRVAPNVEQIFLA